MKVLTVCLKTAMDEIAALTFDVSHLLALGLVDCVANSVVSAGEHPKPSVTKGPHQSCKLSDVAGHQEDAAICWVCFRYECDGSYLQSQH